MIQFLAIGHVTLDQTEPGRLPGGSALYSALFASRMGLKAGILTSFGPDFPRGVIPPEIELVSVPSASTTIFRHAIKNGRRALWLLDRAADILAEKLPTPWETSDLVYLCPVAGEVDAGLASAFRNATIGVGPQGWMRSRGKDGFITPKGWKGASTVLPQSQALFVSEEDIPDEESIRDWFDQVPVGFVTRGERGATLFVNGEPYQVEGYRTDVADPTGAGDVFAAAFLIHYQRTQDAWEAAGFATAAASLTVEGEGIEGVPDAGTVEARWKSYRRRIPA
jgi:sugar/nucleoside kinase (ribokinase family)